MYQYKNVFESIAKEITDFEDNTIEIVPGNDFSQYETIKLIELYQSSKFESGEYDSDGFHKFFFNIGNSRCEVESKATDLDTKNIKILGDNGENHLPAYLMGKEVKAWMKDNDFGKVLNEIVDTRPNYGSVVIKVVNSKPYVVPLRNLVLSNPAAESLDHTNIIERHFYTFDELERMPWDKAAIKEAIEKYHKLEESVVPVYERYGWWPETFYKESGDAEKYVYGVAYVTAIDFGAFRQKKTSKEYDVEGILLYASTIKKHPYKESHRKRIRGRWLGLGVIETLFEHQMKVNEIIGNLDKSGFWSAKRLFQTADESVLKNILVEAKNGDVLKSMNGINPIAMEERNLQAYLQELQIWLQKADKDAFSFESATGENLPTNTPFRLGFIQQQAVASFFDKKREDIGLFIKEIIRDLVIPEFKKTSKAQHFFSVIGNDQELQMLKASIADAILRAKAFEMASRIQYAEDLDALKQQVIQQLGPRLFLEIPQSFYDNVKYAIEIEVTGESIDTDSQNQTLSTILQLIGTNPMLLADENTKAIIADIADNAGMASLAQRIASAQPPQMALPTAGSVAAPGQQDQLINTVKKSAI